MLTEKERKLKKALLKSRRMLNGTAQGHIDAYSYLEDAVESATRGVTAQKEWWGMSRTMFSQLLKGDIVYGKSGIERKILSVTRCRGKTTFITLRCIGGGVYNDTVTYVSADRYMFKKKRHG